MVQIAGKVNRFIADVHIVDFSPPAADFLSVLVPDAQMPGSPVVKNFPAVGTIAKGYGSLILLGGVFQTELIPWALCQFLICFLCVLIG